MTGPELARVLVEAGEAIHFARDPAAAAARLSRWAKRERAFNASPAALTVDDIAAARSGGVAPETVACRRGATTTGGASHAPR